MPFAPTPLRVTRFGVFEADFQAGELRKSGIKIKLHDQPLQILAMLLEHPGKLVTRDDIRKNLWSGNTFVDFDHGLNNAVNRLRDALGDSADSPRWIETLPRRGYRFIGTTSTGDPAKESIPSEAQPAAAKYKSEAFSAASVPIAEELPQRRSRRWFLWVVPLAAVLVLVITLQMKKNPASPSSRSFVLPPDDTTLSLIGDDGGSLALSADGTELAFVAVNIKGAALIWVRLLGKLAAEPIAGTDGATFPFWSPDGRSLGFFADGKLKKISLEGGTAITLCDAPFGRGGSWNRDGVIIFAPDSHTGIHKISDSGGTPAAITNVDASIHTTHRWPKFLPDGQHFIYLAANHFRDTTQTAVYRNSLQGEENVLVVSSDADATYASGYLFFLRKNVLMAQPFDPKRGQLQGQPRPTVEKVLQDPSIWKAVFDASENGVMAYQLGENANGTQLRWFDRSGKQLSLLGDRAFQFEPSLSPDGRKVATNFAKLGTGYGKVWVYDVLRGGRMRITAGEYGSGTPIWSRDGTHILFTGKRQHYSIYSVDTVRAEQERLILDTGIDTWPLDLSPDGHFLLFGQGDDVSRVQSRVWVYPMRGNRAPSRLLEGDTIESGAQFSPDGRWVAYSSNDSGTPEVYVIPFHPPLEANSGSKITVTRKWQISLAGGVQPRWRRDGSELFYLAPDNTLMATPVSSRAAEFEAGTPHPLFHAQTSPLTYLFCYDVSPDGSRFIINTTTQEGRGPITLVQNWPSDFRK